MPWIRTKPTEPGKYMARRDTAIGSAQLFESNMWWFDGHLSNLDSCEWWSEDGFTPKRMEKET
jgi:prepilin-type processing-associated H-X9-DG protein